MDSLYRVIRKADVILVEGNSDISRMIKLFTQSSWSHSALYIGDAVLTGKGGDKEAMIKQFGNDAHHMIVEAFTGTGVTAAPIRKYQDYNIRVWFYRLCLLLEFVSIYFFIVSIWYWVVTHIS